MTQCGSLCGPAYSRHTDPLCSTFCSGHIQAHWPWFTFPPDSLLIRDLQDWSDWERKGWDGECGGGDSVAKKAFSPSFPTLRGLVHPLNNKCSFSVDQLCKALFIKNVNQ